MSSFHEKNARLDDDFGRRVALALNESAKALPASLSDRLAAARREALSRKKSDQAPLFFTKSSPSAPRASRRPFWRGSFALALCGAISFFALLPPNGRPIWSAADEQNADVDVSLLSFDAPLEAWVDPGFAAYLKTQSASGAPAETAPQSADPNPAQPNDRDS